MMKLKKTTVAVLIAVNGLAACGTPALYHETRVDKRVAEERYSHVENEIGKNINAATTRGTAAYADRLAAEQSNMPTLRRASTAWLGSVMVPVTSDEKLPLIFKQNYNMDFDDRRAGRRLSLDQVAARLTEITKVPVRVHPDVTRDGSMGGGMQSPMPLPASSVAPLPSVMPGAPMRNAPVPDSMMAPLPSSMGYSVNTVDMKWHGTLTGFLNHLTDQLGLAWEYRDNTIVIMKYVTEFHEIAAINSKSTFDMSAAGSSSGSNSNGGASTDASSKQNVSETGVMDAVASIEKAVGEMVKGVAGSSVTRADGSGRLVVRTTREMQAQVRDFIKAENSSMLRQAQIQFDIYSVRTNDADERGVDWNMVLNTLNNIYGFSFASPSSLTSLQAGSAGITILSGGTSETSRRFGGSSAILTMLNQLGDNVQHRPVSLLALNRTWARKAKLSTEGYLSETTPAPASSAGAGGTPGLKTDKVTTGDQYVALPQILDNNTVLLKFGLTLSDLLGLFDVTSGTGLNQQKVQVPSIQSVNDQAMVALKPGQTMVITGLSRQVSSTDRRALAEGMPTGLGGSSKISKQREHFIIFVRPVIL